MNEKLIEILDFEIECIEEFASHMEGNSLDGIYVQSKILIDPYYNYFFSSNDLTDEQIKIYSNRFIENDRIPSFQVLTGSKGEETCLANSMVEFDVNLLMKCDLSAWDENRQNTLDSLEIKQDITPYTKEFLSVFEAGFIKNEGGIGYQLGPEWLDAYKAISTHKTLDEITYVSYENSVPTSIAQTSVDIKNMRAFLFNVTTVPKFRRLRHSRTVVTRAMQNAKQLGVQEIYLSTEENSPMEKFYETLGFSPVGTTKLFVVKN